MANIAKMAILRAKIEGVVTDLMLKTNVDHVYVDDTTTLATKLGTLAASADLQALQQTVNALGALAKKDKVSYADLESALAALIDGKAEASALTEEIARAKAAEEAAAAAAAAAQADADALEGRMDTAEGDIDALEGRMDTAEGKITTMIGEDAGKSVRTIANEELAAQLIGESAKESLDTLAEIAAWIQSHPDDASAMNEAIVALQNKVDTGDQTVSAYVTAAINALSIGDYAKAADLTDLAGRVTTAEGKITTVEGKVSTLEGTVAGLGDLAVLDEVAEDNLSAELREKVNAASEGNHSHNNKDVIDGITAEKVTAWDAAEQNAKTYAKDYADTLNSAMNGRMTAVEGKAHEHANKDVLDGITAANIASWNGKAKVYGASETVDLAEGEIYIQLV